LTSAVRDELQATRINREKIKSMSCFMQQN